MLGWILAVAFVGFVVVPERMASVMRAQARIEAKLDAINAKLDTATEAALIAAENGVENGKAIRALAGELIE